MKRLQLKWKLGSYKLVYIWRNTQHCHPVYETQWAPRRSTYHPADPETLVRALKQKLLATVQLNPEGPSVFTTSSPPEYVWVTIEPNKADQYFVFLSANLVQ